MRTRVKFCGITSAQDAQAAAAAGADAIGFVFYPPAAVAVTAQTAAEIAAALPPFVDTTALFVNAEADTVQQVIDTVKPRYLQFHGDEDAGFCRRFALPYIKVCRVQRSADIVQTIKAHPLSCAVLLDRYDAGKPGGTGCSFDWTQIPAEVNHPLIVAGGLTADTVGALVRQARPWAVDVSSGIAELNNRRQKNWDKMRDFIRSVRDADIS